MSLTGTIFFHVFLYSYLVLYTVTVTLHTSLENTFWYTILHISEIVNYAFLKSLTILPSPLPKSTSLPDRPVRAHITFFICVAVAGTYGRQIRCTAGKTKGRHTTLRATAVPPITEFKTRETLFHVTTHVTRGKWWMPYLTELLLLLQLI